MTRKFRIKKNPELSPFERRVNQVSLSIIIISTLLFIVLGMVFKFENGRGSGRDAAGLLAIPSIMITIGLAVSLQLEVKMRLLFSISMLAFSLLSFFEMFLLYIYVSCTVLTVITLAFIGYSHSINILFFFPKKLRKSISSKEGDNVQ
ncbi:MAG: hypothetical protein COA79_18190 [Planctomycetota bacterium]|nr:MAG: hypothetical protein COA79_18190 [Planctomycetota bacterium]